MEPLRSSGGWRTREEEGAVLEMEFKSKWQCFVLADRERGLLEESLHSISGTGSPCGAGWLSFLSVGFCSERHS